MTEDKLDSCECCNYETKELNSYPRNSTRFVKQPMWLCDICASSNLGNLFDFHSEPTSLEILQQVAWMINYVMENKK